MDQQHWAQVKQQIEEALLCLEKAEMIVRNNPDDRRISFKDGKVETDPAYSQAQADLLEFIKKVNHAEVMLPTYMWE